MWRLTLHRSLCTTFGFIVFGAVGLSSCAAFAHRSSPWEYGPGVRLAPAMWDIGDEGTTAHPVVQYAYLNHDGGHESMYGGGVQIRKPTDLFASADQSRPNWFAIEAMAALLRDSYEFDGGDFSESNGGVAATAFFGRPVSDGEWQPSAYAGFGFSHFGGFGINIIVGVDVQPPFLVN